MPLGGRHTRTLRACVKRTLTGRFSCSLSLSLTLHGVVPPCEVENAHVERYTNDDDEQCVAGVKLQIHGSFFSVVSDSHLSRASSTERLIA